MTKLSDTQLVILSATCQRADRLVLPLPDRLKGGAAQKVVASMIAKGLIEEVDAKRGDPVWRETGDGHGVTLVAMLQRPEGATVAEIADALGWQHHTVRGAIAGALKKKLGLDVESEKVDERGRVYRIGA